MAQQTHPSALPSQILARQGWWLATATLLSRVPIASLDAYSVGRLRYALLMAHRTHSAACQRIVQRLLRKNQNANAGVLIELAMMAVSIADPSAAVHLLQKASDRAQDHATRDAARRLLALQIAAGDGTLWQRITQLVDGLQLPDGQLLTLVPVSSRYLDLWQLWLQQTRQFIPGMVVAIAMDDEALAALGNEPAVAVVDLRDIFAWSELGKLHPHTRGALWWLRVLLLQALVEQGHTVLVLDLDALAVGELQPILDADPSADVIAQQDQSIPMDVARKFGFVLCCGFMLWRPTPASNALLDRFAAESAIERDDQLALNHLLSRDGLSDQTRDEHAMRFRAGGVSFACPAPSLVSRDLETGSIIRHFHQTGKSTDELRRAIGVESSKKPRQTAL